MYLQASVGVHIENNRVSLVYLKRSLRGVTLAGHAACLLEKEGHKDKAAEVSRMVNGFLGVHGIPSADIFLGIQRDWAILRYIELPLAVRENLKGSLLYEMEKYVPLAVSDIYFDFQIVAEDRAAGKMTVLLVAVRKDVVDAYLDGENRLGSGISGLEISATALANCLSAESGRSDADTRAFLSVADGHVELGLVKTGRLHYSRHVKTGQQEESRRRLVNDELDLLRKSPGADPDFLEVVCRGISGSPAELFGEREGVHFAALDLSGRGLPSDSLAVAYGLALKGIRKTPMDINLIPADLRKKVSKTAYYTMMGLIGLLALMLLAWGGSCLLHQRRVAGRLESELKRLGAEVETIQRTRDEVRDLENRMDAINALRRQHLPALDILRELSRDIPPDAWFSKFSIVDGKGEVEGNADSASALIPLLAASPLLQDVAFLSPITKDKDGKEKFRIGFTVK